MMSKRLQVLLEEAEFDQIRAVARRHRMTVAEWVRQSLRRSRAEEPAVDSETKWAALERASEHSFPTADIDQVLAEIESGHAGRTT